MTILEVVNSVLRRLREDTVADLSDPYAMLIAEFVADIHKEVVDAHDWSFMDRGVLFQIGTGRTAYNVGLGSADLYAGYTGLSEGAQLRYKEDTQPVACLYETIDDANNGYTLIDLSEASESRVDAAIRNRNGGAARPDEFSFVRTRDYPLGQIRFNTNPDATYFAYFKFHDPEPELDLSVPSYEILAPSKPIVLGATYLALNERGEEMGEPGHVAEQKYRVALSAEIERDRLRLGRTNQYEFARD